MLRECPIDHRCMKTNRRRHRAALRDRPSDRPRRHEARRLPRSRRDPDRGVRLSRSPRAAGVLSLQRRRRARAQPRRLRGRRRHQPGGHRPRHRQGVVRRRGAPAHRRRGSRRAARRSTASTTARTIPSGVGRAVPPDLRLPQAAAGHAARAPRRISISISRARSSSATAGTTSAAGQAVGARGVLVRTGLGRERRSRARSPASTPAAIVDNLIDAAAWILRTAMNGAEPKAGRLLALRRRARRPPRRRSPAI